MLMVNTQQYTKPKSIYILTHMGYNRINKINILTNEHNNIIKIMLKNSKNNKYKKWI